MEDGRNSPHRKYRKVVRERPGLVPSALFHIIGNTVFLRLSDVASGLPDYEIEREGRDFPSLEQGQGFANVGDESLFWYSNWRSGDLNVARFPRDRLGYFEVVPNPSSNLLPSEDPHQLYCREHIGDMVAYVSNDG